MSVLILSLVVVPFYTLTTCLIEEVAGLKMSRLTVVFFGLLSAASLGPLALATLGHASVHGCRRIFSAIWTFWLSGAKFIFLFLVLILPVYTFNKVVQYIAQAVWGDSDLWIELLVGLASLIIAPLWTAPLWLRFSQVLLGKDWVDRLSRNIMDQQG